MNSNDRNRRSSRREIRQALLNLGSPIIVENRNCEGLGFYRYNGFCVMKAQFEVEQAVIDEMKDKFQSAEFPFSAVHEGQGRNRCHRLQAGRRSIITRHLNGRSIRSEFGDYGEFVLEQVQE